MVGERWRRRLGGLKGTLRASAALRFSPECKTCARQRGRKQASRRGSDYIRASNIKRMHGLSLDNVREMRARQGDRCPICEEPLGPSHEEAAIDHCARTGLVRGLLHPCATPGFWHFGDDPERLRRAAQYLEEERHRLGDPDASFIPAHRLEHRSGT